VKNMLADRNEEIDVVKGIAMFLVVWGHCIQCIYHFSTSDEIFSDPIERFILTFHMPLFALISGYLFCKSIQKSSLDSVMTRRVIYLGIPCVVWSFVYPAVRDIVLGVVHHHFSYHPFNMYWFITSMLFCSAVCYLCERVGKGRVSIYIIAFIVTLLMPDWREFGMHYNKFMLLYFIAGLHFCRYSSRVTGRIYLCAFAGALLVHPVLLWFWSVDDYIYTSGMDLFSPNHIYMLRVISYRYLAGFTGSILVLYLVYIVRNRVSLVRWMRLNQLGKYSLQVYIISILLNAKILPSLPAYRESVLFYDLLVCPVYAIMVCIVCVYISKGIGKLRWIRVLLLGLR
jgi:fucose 4-O-acetylase-like acetyltransferase